MPNTSSKQFKALSILGILIALSLIVIFIINAASKENEATIKIIKDHYTIYVSGLAALFIIMFRLFLYSYQKILTTITAVTALILLIPGYFEDNVTQPRFHAEPLYSPLADTISVDSTYIQDRIIPQEMAHPIRHHDSLPPIIRDSIFELPCADIEEE